MFEEVIDCLTSNKLIQSYEVLEYFDEDIIKLIKIKAHLIDNSTLFKREIIKPDSSNYSYHWQDDSGNLIFRWDNAPYHPDIVTFPHHLHKSIKIVSAYRVNINEVLTEIEKYLDS